MDAAVLEPLPTLEHEPRTPVATSLFGSKGVLRLHLSVGEPKGFGRQKQAPVFPGEMVYGLAEFTPNGSHFIDCLKLHVRGEVNYSEKVRTSGLVADTETTYSWHETLFNDVFDIPVPVETAAVTKNRTVTWPFQFQLNHQAKPWTEYSSTSLLLTIKTKDNQKTVDPTLDFLQIANLSSGYAMTNSTCHLVVGSSPFPDPAIVVRQCLNEVSTKGVLSSMMLGGSVRNDADAFIIKSCQWAAPFEASAKDVNFTTGWCCSSGLADVAVSLAHRIIYVAPRWLVDELAPLRGSWGRMRGGVAEGKPVSVRMVASAGITTRKAKLPASAVRLRLVGCLRRKRAPQKVEDVNEMAPPVWDTKEICCFMLSEEPREGSELVLTPVDVASGSSWSEFTPSFFSNELAMTYLLELTNGMFGELLKVPVWVTNNPCALPGYRGAVNEAARQAHAAEWERNFAGKGAFIIEGGVVNAAESAPESPAASAVAADPELPAADATLGAAKLSCLQHDV